MDRIPSEKETLDSLLRRVQGGDLQDRPVASAFEKADADGVRIDLDAGQSREELLRGIHLKVRAELGRIRLPVREAIQLGPGSVVDLGKGADDPVDIYVNDLLVARGEVMVLNDSFCIRITEVFSQGATGQEATP